MITNRMISKHIGKRNKNQEQEEKQYNGGRKREGKKNDEVQIQKKDRTRRLSPQKLDMASRYLTKPRTDVQHRVIKATVATVRITIIYVYIYTCI